MPSQSAPDPTAFGPPTPDPPAPDRPRRADARRSRAAILDAAIHLLGEHPDASVENIAAAARVTRQTVYAHFPSREALLHAVLQQVTDEAMAAMDAAELDVGPPAAALLRFIDAAWQVFERYPVALSTAAAAVNPQEDQALHEPVIEQLVRLIRRGQRTGDFDDQLSATWLLAATMALGHAAGAEAAAGRLTVREAATVMRTSVLRLFCVPDEAIGDL